MDAFEIIKLSFVIYLDTSTEIIEDLKNFNSKVIEKMADWPFYCTYCDHTQQVKFIYSLFLLKFVSFF